MQVNLDNWLLSFWFTLFIKILSDYLPDIVNFLDHESIFSDFLNAFADLFFKWTTT